MALRAGGRAGGMGTCPLPTWATLSGVPWVGLSLSPTVPMSQFGWLRLGGSRDNASPRGPFVSSPVSGDPQAGWALSFFISLFSY